MHLSRLSALEEIRRLKARYFRALDTQDWEAFRAVFTDDARIGPIESGYPDVLLAPRPAARAPIESAEIDAFIQRVAANSVGRVTVHHGHQPEIELTGENDATGIWAMEDVLVWPEDGHRLRGAGHYWETYRYVDGEWRISSMRLTRLYSYVDQI